jgi:protein O-GlcNAc transferase
LWAEILGRVPGSRLAVLDMPAAAADAFVADMARRGVAPERVTVVSRVPPGDYFRWYNEVDVALDTTPYSGGTTTCDTLWMGVPVVTLPGARSASRSAGSILTTVGLPDWIASSPEEYVARAVAAAADAGRLRGLRASLRGRMRASALMDEPQFARDMEGAYRRMWRTWCATAR